MDLLIPSTFAADERDMKLQVMKYGMLARSAAIFGIERIIIYTDPDPNMDASRQGELLEKYLNYAECPPYLRKALIPRDDDLKYASIMPALQILSHGYSDEFREAVIEDVDEGVLELDAGLDEPLTAYGDREEGERVTVKRIQSDQAQIIDPESLDGFWTYDVLRPEQELGAVLETITKPVIATSFHGSPVETVEDDIASYDDCAILFGSAWRGIPTMEDRGDLESDQYDLLVNLVPEQETKTIRTEEAITIGLGLLSHIRRTE
ncbi:MAG: hypothetical protein MUP66_02245 [Candidatus Nanohaloarchaeota archaeon QJJ-5]|nr:hypothetical protein [Candidatus Nanohaloarchaeota archaeon QJJ-5]